MKAYNMKAYVFTDEFIEWYKEVKNININESYYYEDWESLFKQYEREKKLKELGI